MEKTLFHVDRGCAHLVARRDATLRGPSEAKLSLPFLILIRTGPAEIHIAAGRAC